MAKGSKVTEKVVKECRDKLMKTKMDLLNRVKEAREKLDLGEKGGDEADQTMRLLAEQEMLNLNYGLTYNYCIEPVKLTQLLNREQKSLNAENIYAIDTIKPLITPSVIMEDVSTPFYTEEFININFLTNKIKELNDTLKSNIQQEDKPKIK